MRTVVTSALVLSALALSFAGCAAEDPEGFVNDDYHAHEESPLASEEEVAAIASRLVATDPVSAVVSAGCSTGPVMPLARQLNDEVNCLSPNTMTSIKDLPGLRFTSADVFPFMQTFAVNSLKKVIAGRPGVTMALNSGLRTLPEQFVLYQYFRQKRCGITLAATPGTSNHESGLAVDIQDNAGWRQSFLNQGWKWQGASDPVHYDIAGGVNIRGLSVRAFQRLWNRNHPEDRIAEDGAYGPMTEARLLKSPIGGFPVGAMCDAKPDAGSDAGPADAGAADGEATEDPQTPAPDTGSEGGSDAGESPTPSEGTGSNGAGSSAPSLTDEGSSGCSTSPRRAGDGALGLGLGLAAVGLTVARRRRRA